MVKIYAVENVVTKFVYVGVTTQKGNRRLNEHRSRMRKGVHDVTAMTDDFVKYGGQSFRIFTLEELCADADVPSKREAELRWMHHYKAIGLLYNNQLISFQPGAGYKLRSHTPEANEKRRLAQLGKPKGHGAKISASKKALGQRPTLEAAKAGGKRACELKWNKC